MNKMFFQSFFPEGIYVVPEKEPTKYPEPIALVEPEIEIIKRKVTYIGENHKRILLVIHDPQEPINEPDKEFLSKILAAVRLTFNDIALVNSYSYSALDFSELEENISFTKVILFGSELFKLVEEFQISKYDLMQSEDIEILYSDSLAEVQEDKVKKIKLWESLKKMFP